MVEGCAALLALALEREKFLRVARTAEEIRAREEIKSTLLATLAHDLKTPVTGARMAVENLEAQSGESEASRQALEAVSRLSRTIDDLLKVVKLEAGASLARAERVSAAAILEAAVARFGELLAEHRFAVDMPPAELQVVVDPAQVTEAVGLVLENAARYSPRGGRVHLSALSEGGSVVFRVEDSGPGIPDVERERVFEKFVRLEGTSSLPGSGLGLYIARTLVEMNGGTMRLGPSPAGGAAVDVVMPRNPGALRTETAA
jgi:two-component system sensor histidine kinase KdpD